MHNSFFIYIYMRFSLDVHPKKAEMKSIKTLVLAYKTINRQSSTHLATSRNMTHTLDPHLRPTSHVTCHTLKMTWRLSTLLFPHPTPTTEWQNPTQSSGTDLRLTSFNNNWINCDWGKYCVGLLAHFIYISSSFLSQQLNSWNTCLPSVDHGGIACETKHRARQ